VECAIDNAFNLRDLVLKELVKIIAVCYVKNLRLKFKCGISSSSSSSSFIFLPLIRIGLKIQMDMEVVILGGNMR
jgi:hypothetical protein